MLSALGQADVWRRNKSCPLYPRKRTFRASTDMSALGQKRTFTIHSIVAPLCVATDSKLLPRMILLRKREALTLQPLRID
jgi:hypothetical protein